MDNVGLTVDIPLIITAAMDKQRKKSGKKRKKSAVATGKKPSIEDGHRTITCASLSDDLSRLAKVSEHRKRSVVGGSLKYEIGRERPSIIGFPLKCSSVRIKGTGHEETTLVKVEPCNGMPTHGTAVNMKDNLGSVSFEWLISRDVNRQTVKKVSK